MTNSFIYSIICSFIHSFIHFPFSTFVPSYEKDKENRKKTNNKMVSSYFSSSTNLNSAIFIFVVVVFLDLFTFYARGFVLEIPAAILGDGHSGGGGGGGGGGRSNVTGVSVALREFVCRSISQCLDDLISQSERYRRYRRYRRL